MGGAWRMRRGDVHLGWCLLCFPVPLTLTLAIGFALVHGIWLEVTGACVDLKLPESRQGSASLLFASTHHEKKTMLERADMRRRCKLTLLPRAKLSQSVLTPTEPGR